MYVLHIFQKEQHDGANAKNNNKEMGDREIIPMYLSVICCSPSPESSPSSETKTPTPHVK